MKWNEKIGIEYQKAQDSAEHHNTMIWTLMSLGIALSLWILHISWTRKDLDPLYSLIILFFGAYILFYFSYLIEKANKIKKLKYDICKDIEDEFDFFAKQHKKSNSKGSGIKLFTTIKIVIFLFYAFTLVFGPYLSVITVFALYHLILLVSTSLIIIFSLIMELQYLYSRIR